MVLHDIAWMVRLRCHWCWNHLKSESVRCWFVLDRNKHKSCDFDAANKSGFLQERLIYYAALHWESEEVASRIDFDTRRCNSRILKSLEQHNKRSDDWYCKNIEI